MNQSSRLPNQSPQTNPPPFVGCRPVVLFCCFAVLLFYCTHTVLYIHPPAFTVPYLGWRHCCASDLESDSLSQPLSIGSELIHRFAMGDI